MDRGVVRTALRWLRFCEGPHAEISGDNEARRRLSMTA
jgi:hypothetical protein